MKLGCAVEAGRSLPEALERVRAAERLGYESVWSSQLPGSRDTALVLAAYAQATERVRLGTAVTNPLTRHPTVTAAAFSTLAELSGGRASLGISVGDSALKSMNLEVAKMSVLAESIALCRKLLGGEAVSFGEGKTAQLHHVGPRVPIYVAATGPRMLELAGRIADGVILMNGIAPELIREAVRIVREGERAAARQEGNVKIAVWAACHPSHQSGESKLVRTAPEPCALGGKPPVSAPGSMACVR